MTSPRTVDVAVVGGGIAGLSAAWRLRDRDITVFEADKRVGGRVMSEPRGANWLNVGAHLFSPPGSAVGDLVDELGLSTEKVQGDFAAIAWNGKLVRGGSDYTMPLRLPLSPLGRVSLALVGARLKLAVRRLRRQLPSESGPVTRQARAEFMGDESFADFLGKMHPEVRSLFTVVAQRLTARVDQLTAGSGVNVIGHVWDRSYADQVRNMRGGSSLFPDALARELGDKIELGCKVVRIEPQSDRRLLTVLEGGRESQFLARAVVVAVPAFVAAEIVSDLPPEVRAALQSIEYGPFVVGGILTSEDRAMPWDDIYAVATPGRSFNMLFNVVNILRGDGPREPGGSLMCYGGGDLGRELLELSDDEVSARFLTDLCEIFPEVEGNIGEIVIRRVPAGMPFMSPGRAKLQPVLERPLGNLFLAGDYLDWADMDAAVSTGYEAAARVQALLTREPSHTPLVPGDRN